MLLLWLVRFFQTLADDFTDYRVVDHPINQLDHIER